MFHSGAAVLNVKNEINDNYIHTHLDTKLRCYKLELVLRIC
jgi:hypothetical protein